ncbi:XRN 5'-3' exonuclease N-terminus-domain-containing protein [Phycomyces blakesleeanus]|uniref:XRN 5'-3' exonuclease N-terminus-domain-containing protein n=1 Tax=Phycomyces blakesleeanus TaxID=4837 RepID=A0ABR3B933_PHYBL
MAQKPARLIHTSFYNLYFDITQTIHLCFEKIELTNIDPKTFKDEVMEAVFSKIEEAVDHIHPRRLIFIAFDGIPPAIKLQKQIYTRTSKNRLFERPSDKEYSKKYDKNLITPGTSFMEKLGDYIRYRLSEKLTYNDHWEDIRILLSDTHMPGTGEWKIMSYIRSLEVPPPGSPELRHMIWGSDRNLILMGLLCEDSNILFTEGITYTEEETPRNIFKVVHAGTLREAIEKEYAFLKAQDGFEYDTYSLIRDYVLLNVIMGTSFLRYPRSLNRLSESMKVVLDAYKNFLLESNGHLYENQTINHNRLGFFFEKLLIPMRDLYSAEKANDIIQEFKKFNINSISTGTISRTEQIKSSQKTRERKIMAEEYIRGIHWTMEYFQSNIVSWTWYYPFYRLTPAIFELIEIQDLEVPIFDLGEPMNIYVYIQKVFPDFNVLVDQLASEVL